MDRQYIAYTKPFNVPKLPLLIFLPYLGVYSIRLKKEVIKFLGKIYPHSEYRFAFQSTSRIESFSLLNIVSPVTLSLRLFTSLRAGAARLLIMAKHHATLLFVVESIQGLTKKVKALKAFLHPLGIILIILVIVLPSIAFVF